MRAYGHASSFSLHISIIPIGSLETQRILGLLCASRENNRIVDEHNFILFDEIKLYVAD